MSPPLDSQAAPGAPVDVRLPAEQTMPVVFASPHSGAAYPPEFLAASRLDAFALRKSEDSFVDEIFAAAPALGAPLLRALFPRAYIDPNREPFELDPAMFEDELPAYANTASPRVAAGLGTIARVVASGEEIYGGKLNFAEATARLERCYRPYHDALRRVASVAACWSTATRCPRSAGRWSATPGANASTSSSAIATPAPAPPP